MSGLGIGLGSKAEFRMDVPGEREGEGDEEDREEWEDRGLLGLCAALPNDPPASPTLSPPSLNLPPLNSSSSIFCAGMLKVWAPGASGITLDDVPSILACPNFT